MGIFGKVAGWLERGRKGPNGTSSPQGAPEGATPRSACAIQTLAQLQAFIEAGGLRLLTALDLSARRWEGSRFAGLLSRCDDVARLRSLTLADDRMDATAVEPLARSGVLAQLESLDLHGNPLGDEGACRLAESRCLRPRALDLSGTGLGDRGLAALAAAPLLQQLEELRLSGNRITAEGLKALFGARPARLRTLDLGGNPIGNTGARALADTDALAALETLDLGRAEIGSEGVWALASAAGLARLRQLSLQRNRLEAAAAKALAGATLQLVVLRLSQNPLGDEGVVALARSTQLARLEELHLTRTGVGDEAAAALARASFPVLRVLCLGNNRIGSAGAAALLQRTPTIARLLLAGNTYDPSELAHQERRSSGSSQASG